MGVLTFCQDRPSCHLTRIGSRARMKRTRTPKKEKTKNKQSRREIEHEKKRRTRLFLGGAGKSKEGIGMTIELEVRADNAVRRQTAARVLGGSKGLRGGKKNRKNTTADVRAGRNMSQQGRSQYSDR